MKNEYPNKHPRSKNSIRLTMICYIMLISSIFIISSCAPTFASVENEEPIEELGSSQYENSYDEKVDKSMIHIDEEEPDESEEELDIVDETDESEEELDIEEEPDVIDEQAEEEWPERVAFLTFDDGPGEYTNRLLDILEEEYVPAIFFLLGESILDTLPDAETSMERILAEGHYIGLHTMTHQYYTLYVGDGAPGRFVAEKFELQELIYDITGHHTYLCRAAYGMMTGFRPGHYTAIDEAGIKCIDWNIDPQDWRNNAQTIYEEVVRQVEMLNFPAEIVIVLHEYEQTVQALPNIISYLREQGYVFKTYEPGYQFIYPQNQQ